MDIFKKTPLVVSVVYSVLYDIMCFHINVYKCHVLTSCISYVILSVHIQYWVQLIILKPTLQCQIKLWPLKVCFTDFDSLKHIEAIKVYKRMYQFLMNKVYVKKIKGFHGNCGIAFILSFLNGPTDTPWVSHWHFFFNS